MFDWVECRYSLPKSLGPGEGFQTKDLTNALLLYVITENGRLEKSSGTEDRSDFTGSIVLSWSNARATTAARLALEKREFGIQDLESALPGVNRRTLQRELKALVDSGILVASGAARSVLYSLAENL